MTTRRMTPDDYAEAGVPVPDHMIEPRECEACDATDADGNEFCEGCDCCQECCNCTESDCDCPACDVRRENELD